MELSNRELEVIRHVAHGLSNAEVATKLFISEQTVKTHIRRVLSKLDARNRTHAVAIIAMNAPEMLR